MTAPSIPRVVWGQRCSDVETRRVLLRTVSLSSISVALLSAAIIGVHVAGNRQPMWIMNVVWPVTALFAGPLALLAYFTLGTSSLKHHPEASKKKPFWQSVIVGTLHCGAGCTLGDLVAEWLLFFVPLTLFGRKLFMAWVIDYVIAFLFGIAFQYFTIKPVKGLSTKQGLIAALKADSLSLTAWQVGMYGWMAIVVFVMFGHELEKTDPLFWFMMQVAMLAGFLTSLPINWWLVGAGIKESM